MLGKMLIAIGVTSAAVGFGVWGIATSTYNREDQFFNAAYYLMAAGILAAIVGGILYRMSDQRA